MVFPSKKSIWMSVVVWAIILACILPPILSIDPIGVIMLPEILNNKVITTIILLIPAIYLLWVWFGTRYEIQQSTLKVHFGPYKKIIDICAIKTIRRTKNPFIAPALSEDRIEINYNKFESIHISPKDKGAFVRQILKVNPHIQVDSKSSLLS
ncbi:PH domain-containing protein [Bacillus sp. WMMC1349]|uniref:PH domain-containing protein n=1 Tax=Bacillus sp. WMMC1349 TaxID=2736254 RepID=UPI001557E6F9|nr:PH domain-containing protein [Bacillus sp. WMMC1349]NPC91294.1 PH domain-containing protein [Bacillus sp. WMMC1349]